LVLTDAQRRHREKKLLKEQKEIKKMATSTYRDRMEQFNYKLSVMTEHNDIPRVSAAGNG
jgi:protein FAM32A